MWYTAAVQGIWQGQGLTLHRTGQMTNHTASREAEASSTVNVGPAVDLNGDPTRAGDKMRELNPAHLEPERTDDKSINQQTSMP